MDEQFLENQDRNKDSGDSSSNSLDESVVFEAVFGSLPQEQAGSRGSDSPTDSSKVDQLDTLEPSGQLNLAQLTDSPSSKPSLLMHSSVEKGIEPTGSVVTASSQTDSYANLSTSAKVFDIAGGALANAPGLYASELKRDIVEDPLSVAQTFGVSAGIGFAATGILKKAPRSGKAMLATAALWQAYSYGSRAVDFLSEAGEAQSHAQRDSLVYQGSLGIAREGVLLTEAAPGLLLGGNLGVRTFGKPELYQSVQNGVKSAKAAIGESRIAKAVQSTPPGQALSRYSAFHGRGTIDLPLSVKVKPTSDTPFTRVNVMQIDELIGGSKGNQFNLYEEGRAIDVLNLKASRKLTGSHRTQELDMGFVDRVGHIRQHTHRPGHELPSLQDVQSTRHLGIIHSGDKTTFYVGRMAEYNAGITESAKLGQKLAAPDVKLPIQGVTLDKTSGTASLFESVPGGGNSNIGLFTRRTVSYDEAANALSKLDLGNPWAQLRTLGDGS